jgi:hypothetical protein
MNVTFKPELPQRIFWGVGAVLFSFPVIEILVEVQTTPCLSASS